MTVTAEAVVDEMAGLVREASEPVSAGERVDQLIRRAARRLGLTYSRCKGLWYREITGLKAWEADNLRARRRELAAARLRELEQTYERLRADVAADPLLGPLAPPPLGTSRGRR